MPYDVPEGTDHTTFRGRNAGKAGKDAHPARAGAAILAFVLSHAPQESSKTDQATLRAGIRKGCSTFERMDAFLNSMPFSDKSAQSRPSLVEGFLSNALAHR